MQILLTSWTGIDFLNIFLVFGGSQIWCSHRFLFTCLYDRTEVNKVLVLLLSQVWGRCTCYGSYSSTHWLEVWVQWVTLTDADADAGECHSTPQSLPSACSPSCSTACTTTCIQFWRAWACCGDSAHFIIKSLDSSNLKWVGSIHFEDHSWSVIHRYMQNTFSR